jgi:hypothetical protein
VLGQDVQSLHLLASSILIDQVSDIHDTNRPTINCPAMCNASNSPCKFPVYQIQLIPANPTRAILIYNLLDCAVDIRFPPNQ